MNFKHKINIFLENKKWLDKKIFKSKKSIDNFIYYLSQITINECFLQPKFKKFKNLKTNINFILADDRSLKKLNTDFLNKKKSTNVLSFPNKKFFNDKDVMVLPAIGYSFGVEMGWNAKLYNFGVTGGIYFRQYGHSMDNLGGAGFPDIHNYYKMNH